MVNTSIPSYSYVCVCVLVCVMTAFKIYSISDFQVCTTVSLAIVHAVR